MTTSEAEAITAKLFAAWPSPLYGDMTVRVYVDEIEKFDYHRALDALDRLIMTAYQRPSVAELRDMYLSPALRDKHAQKALPMPRVTQEERDANLNRIQELYDHLGWGDSRESVRDLADKPTKMDD